MSVFEIPQSLSSLNFGTDSMLTQELLPVSSAVVNSRPGYGVASGLTQWQFRETSQWFSPALSYFELRGHFTDLSGNALPKSAGIGYTRNWWSTLFSQLELLVNGHSIEVITNNVLVDTVNIINGAKHGYLKSFASAYGWEPLMDRIANSSSYGTAAPSSSNYNTVVATFKPSLSIFNLASIPCGAEIKLNFTWNPNGEQAMIESLTSKIAGVDYIFVIDKFVFQKCSLRPDPALSIPPSGKYDLSPIMVNQYPITQTNQAQFNVSVPGMTNRLTLVFQDNNLANSFAVGQNGLNAITKFRPVFSSGASNFVACLSQIWVQLPELGGGTYPSPVYSMVFNDRASFGRLYSDFQLTSQGNIEGNEGAIPFGNFDTGIGAEIIAPNATPAAVYNPGDRANDDRAIIYTTAASALTSQTYNQTALYGFLGSSFVVNIPVLRPQNRPITTAIVNVQFNTTVTSVQMSVLSSYSQCLAVANMGSGTYDFKLMTGV